MNQIVIEITYILMSEIEPIEPRVVRIFLVGKKSFFRFESADGTSEDVFIIKCAINDNRRDAHNNPMEMFVDLGDVVERLRAGESLGYPRDDGIETLVNLELRRLGMNPDLQNQPEAALRISHDPILEIVEYDEGQG